MAAWQPSIELDPSEGPRQDGQKTTLTLIQRADDSVGSPDAIHSLRLAEIKLANRANELNGKLLDSNDASRTIAAKQLAISESANNLAKEMLASNQQSSEISEKNAEALNNATLQLAKSTSGLNRATWILTIGSDREDSVFSKPCDRTLHLPK
jgi:hypothetical protein